MSVLELESGFGTSCSSASKGSACPKPRLTVMQQHVHLGCFTLGKGVKRIQPANGDWNDGLHAQGPTHNGGHDRPCRLSDSGWIPTFGLGKRTTGRVSGESRSRVPIALLEVRKVSSAVAAEGMDLVALRD